MSFIINLLCNKLVGVDLDRRARTEHEDMSVKQLASKSVLLLKPQPPRLISERFLCLFPSNAFDSLNAPTTLTHLTSSNRRAPDVAGRNVSVGGWSTDLSFCSPSGNTEQTTADPLHIYTFSYGDIKSLRIRRTTPLIISGAIKHSSSTF